MNLLIRIIHGTCALSIILLFAECRPDNYRTVAEFYSSAEKSDSRTAENDLASISEIDLQLFFKNAHERGRDDFYDFETQAYLVHEYAPSIKWEGHDPQDKSTSDSEHTKTNPIILKELQLAQLSLALEDDLLQLEEIDKIEAVFATKVNAVDIYLLARLLLIKSKYLFEHNYYEYAFSTAQYGRHLLTSSSLYGLDFPLLQVELLDMIGLSLNGDETKTKQALIAYKKALEMVIEYQWDDKMKHFELIVGSMDNNPEHKQDITSWHTFADETKSRTLGEYLNSNLVSIDMIEKNLDLMIDICNGITDPRIVSQHYRMLYFIFQDSKPSLALHYAAIALSYRSPKQTDQLWMDFYNKELKIEIYAEKYHQTKSTKYLDSVISTTFEYIEMTNEIFADPDDSHVDDLALGQAVELANVLTYRDTLSSSEAENFLQLVASSQAQEVKKINRAVRLDNGRLVTADDSLNVRIAQIKLQLDDYYNLVDASPTSYEELYDLYKHRTTVAKNKALKKLDVARIHARLKQENAAYIGFLFYPDEEVICYMVDRNALRIRKLPAQQTDSLSRCITSSILNKKSIASSDLGSQLLPFDLKNLHRVYITSDGPLTKVPLSIFSDTEAHFIHVSGPSQLIQLHSSDLASNSTSIFNLSSKSTIQDKKQTKMARELPEGLVACNQIANILSVDHVIAGEHMTESALLASMPHDILHLSTHGFSNDTIVNKNSILVRDGMEMIHLNATQLDGLPNYPRFAYLDGCNTGSGVTQVGEGTYSIARIFAKNGTETLIKTLWPIDGKSSAFFSTSYYRHWASGMSAIEAFYTAQHDTKVEYPEPYHWAPYIFYGNPDLYLSR